MTLRRRFLAAAAAVGLLSACQTAPPAPKVDAANFAAFAPIMLDVARVDVVDNARRPAGSVDASIAVPPAEGARRWAQARLQAAGRDGFVRLTIREAAIVESQLPKTGGVKGMLTNEQTTRYDARIAVEITAEKPSANGLRASTQANASRFITLPENTSLAGREAALQNLSNRLLEDLNARLDAGVRRDLGRLVTR